MISLARLLESPVLFDHSSNADMMWRGILTGFPVPTPGNIGNEAKQATLQQCPPEDLIPVPFPCGYAGLLSYDLGEQIVLGHQNRPHIASELSPASAINYYTWSYCRQNKEERGILTFSPRCSDSMRKTILAAFYEVLDETLPPRQTAQTTLSWKCSSTFESYEKAFNRLKDYINAGDCYQANLTQRFECDAEPIDSLSFYLEQKARSDGMFFGYFPISPTQCVMSYSPEQFLSIKNRRIETRPIKGTLSTRVADGATKLFNSPKDRAENLMIVDLLRNDLGKICKTGTVKTDKLFEIESYKQLHHMVSHITGELRDEVSALEALLACFPGGSITGAPKKRAMEIINELEEHARSAYCGSMFYWSETGELASNILIRTVVQSKGKLYCWAGGGIVADSELESEYEESLTKVEHITGIKPSSRA